MTDPDALNPAPTSTLAFLAGPAGLSLAGLAGYIATSALNISLPFPHADSIVFAVFASGLLTTTLMLNNARNQYISFEVLRNIGMLLTLVVGTVVWLIDAGAFDLTLAMVFVGLIGVTGLAIAGMATSAARNDLHLSA